MGLPFGRPQRRIDTAPATRRIAHNAAKRRITFGTPTVQGVLTVAPEWYSDWQSAYSRAAAGLGQAHIAVFGDSVSQGYYATAPYYLNGWAGRIGTQIATRTGQSTGTGIIPAYEEFTITDARTSSAGTWTAETGGGFFSKYYLANASGDTYTLGPITCTAFKVMYLTDPIGGAWTATIDGGTPQNYTCNGASGVQFVEIDAGASGSHTLVLAGSGNLLLVAVEAIHNETAGVKVSRITLTDMQASNLTSDLTAASSRQCYLLTNPDLAIVAFGLNEALLGTSTATFKTHLGTVVDDMLGLGASVLILAAPPPNTTTISAVTWGSFRTAMSEVAADKNVGFLDMADYWPSYAGCVEYYNDNVHPNDPGHADMARIVADYVVETVAPSAANTFAPTDISNLGAWWDASHDASFTFHSGTLVSQWNDRSSNNYHLTQGTSGNAPDRRATVNGQRVVVFNGSNSWVTAGDVLDLGTSSISIFAVIKRTVASQNHAFLGKYKVTPADGSWLLYYTSGNLLETIYDAGSLAIADSTSTTSVDSRIVGTIIDRSGGSVTQRIDQATNGTASFTTDSGSSRNIATSVYMGALRDAADTGFYAGYYLGAYVAEVIVYLKALNTTEREQVETYLSDKWGL